MLRAWIVLAAADGLANGAIARELEISVNIVRKWGGRFAALGPDGLRDAERSGRPKSYGYGPDVRVAIEASISAPPHPGVTWSHRAIAQRVAGTCFAPLSASQVGRILAGLDLKPHKVRGWLTRRDTPISGSELLGCALSVPVRPRGGVALDRREDRDRRPFTSPYVAVPAVQRAEVNPTGRSCSTGATARPPSSPRATSAPARYSRRRSSATTRRPAPTSWTDSTGRSPSAGRSVSCSATVPRTPPGTPGHAW
ncbi:hypothetical protein EES39_31715 [Streptomyces sp. ADI92-24]|nr:hypothetical protein EES39_31715 [Streptomyces sp. ADI92-24]